MNKFGVTGYRFRGYGLLIVVILAIYFRDMGYKFWRYQLLFLEIPVIDFSLSLSLSLSRSLSRALSLSGHYYSIKILLFTGEQSSPADGHHGRSIRPADPRQPHPCPLSSGNLVRVAIDDQL